MSARGGFILPLGLDHALPKVDPLKTPPNELLEDGPGRLKPEVRQAWRTAHAPGSPPR